MTPARKEALPRVLVVDDQPANLVAAHALLAPLPVEVVTANSGDEALGLVLRQEFAVILMDVRMPIMDGYETAFLIRGHTEHNPVPIIFVTAEAPEQHAMFHGYESGGVDYLLKPLDGDLLRSKVMVFLELYRHRQSLVQATEALRRSNERMSRLLEMANDGIVGIEPDRSISFVNPAACQMMECKPEQLLQRCARDVFPLQAGAAEHEDPFAVAVAQGRHAPPPVAFTTLLGRRFHAAYALSAVAGETGGSGASYVLVFQDVSERTAATGEGEFNHLDPLTGLPTRLWLEHRIAGNLVRAGRNRPFTLLQLELTGLAAIGRQYGTPVRELLTRAAAERLLTALRASDIAARLDDAGFVVLLPGVSDPEAALGIADKLKAVLEAPFVLTGQSLAMRVSIGIALYPLHGDSTAGLLAALQQALAYAQIRDSGTALAVPVANESRPDEDLAGLSG